MLSKPRESAARSRCGYFGGGSLGYLGTSQRSFPVAVVVKERGVSVGEWADSKVLMTVARENPIARKTLPPTFRKPCGNHCWDNNGRGCSRLGEPPGTAADLARSLPAAELA